MLALDGRADDAIALAEQAQLVDQIEPQPAVEYLADTRGPDIQRGHALFYAGRLVEAAAYADAGIRAAQETDLDFVLGSWLNLSGRIELERGNPATAVLRFGQVLAQMPHVCGGALRSIALNALIEAHALLGQTHSAAHALAALAEKPHNTPWHPAGQAELSRGHLAAAEGRTAAAMELFQSAVQRAAPANASIALVAAHTIARYGQLELGLNLARDLPEIQGPLAPLRLSHMTALVANDTAELIEVASQFERLGADLVAAEAYAVTADIATRQGDHRLATLARRVGRELSARTEGARTPDLLGLVVAQGRGLTPRQRQIAALAARGLSSQAIAAELILYVRTVDNNLSRIYERLGINSRQQIADAITTPHTPPVATPAGSETGWHAFWLIEQRCLGLKVLN